MKNESESHTTDASPPSTEKKSLLEAIKSFRGCVGEGLNDEEFTHFLQKASLPVEGGFEFLSYHSRFVTLGVPRQDSSTWYREKGWVVAEKEKVAREIADKFGLTLYQPPDAVGTHHAAAHADNTHACHHLEMSHNREIVIVIHPLYVKIRLFRATGATQHGWSAHKGPQLDGELLKDLARMY